jgi:tetratricopeptide (TPR) repeat protein
LPLIDTFLTGPVRWFHLLALCGLCCVLYAPGLDGPLQFDSRVALENNPSLEFDPVSFNAWRAAATSSDSGPTGRPLAMLSFAADVALAGGVEPYRLKLVNLLLHCLVGLVGFSLFAGLLGRRGVDSTSARWVAFTASAIWLLHPLQVSTVLYAVQRMEQLSALFVLLGLLVYQRARSDWCSRPASGVEISRVLFLVALCLGCAVLAKEDGLLLLPLLVLTELVFYRGRYADRELTWLSRGSAAALLGAAGLGLLLLVFQPNWLTEGYGGRPFTLVERVLTQARLLWHYLGWFAWPDVTAMGLHHDDIPLSRSLLDPGTTALAVAAWTAVMVAMLGRWRQWWPWHFAILWFVINHALESTLFPLELVYEHRNYLALLGPAMFVSWLVWRVMPAPRPAARAAAATALVLACCLLLVQRTVLWSDEEHMAGYHLAHHPTSLRSVYHFANTQLRLGEAASEEDDRRERLMAARHYYEQMHGLDPTDFTALVSLLYLDSRYFSSMESARWTQGLLQAAQDRKLLSVDRNALGLLLTCVKAQLCEPMDQHFRELMTTLADRHPRSPYYLDLAARHAGEVDGDFAAAIALHEAALQRDPAYLPAFRGLVAWHDRAGQHGQALEVMRRLLAREPGLRGVVRVRGMFGASL